MNNTAPGVLVAWRRSSYCASSECVEVATHAGRILIRDTKSDASPLVYTREEWESFVAGIKAGEFDHLVS